jgi:hypothetical protein
MVAFLKDMLSVIGGHVTQSVLSPLAWGAFPNIYRRGGFRVLCYSLRVVEGSYAYCRHKILPLHGVCK